MLRSADFFDVLRFPAIRFTSASVDALAQDRYAVRGTVEIRGVSQPMVLQTRLVSRYSDPVRRAEIAEFLATGTLQRSAFGMKTDQTMISDRVDITISARIQLGETFRAD